jgi:hypothetical protein
MSTQPEALRLADALDAYHKRSEDKEAAAELRRLHEVNAELLDALKKLCAMADGGDVVCWATEWYDARAAIAKAEGGAV